MAAAWGVRGDFDMSLRRFWQSAVTELAGSLRSRRALVVLALYIALSLLCMNGAISVLGKMEDQLADILQISQEGGRSGVVSAALWRSAHFQRIVRSVVGDSLVYDDICGKHPVELLYAFFAFLYVPLLTIMIAANRIADDLKSGSVRYMITRVTRLEWSLGKYAGIALLLAAGLCLGGVAAWVVAVVRVGGVDALPMLCAMLLWSLKAWMLSLAWLGMALGVSHFFHSGAIATAVATVVMVVFGVAPKIIHLICKFTDAPAALSIADRLFPSAAENGLWRASFSPAACASVWLLFLGLLYFSAGYAKFARGDAR